MEFIEIRFMGHTSAIFVRKKYLVAVTHGGAFSKGSLPTCSLEYTNLKINNLVLIYYENDIGS